MDETRQHARGPRAPAETEEIDAVAFFPILDEKAVGPQNIVIEPVPHCETQNAEELLFRAIKEVDSPDGADARRVINQLARALPGDAVELEPVRNADNPLDIGEGAPELVPCARKRVV